jgi:hypothetical protein
MKITVKQLKGLISEAVAELKAPAQPKTVTLTVGQLKKMVKEQVKHVWQTNVEEFVKDAWEEIQSDQAFMEKNGLEAVEENGELGFKGPVDTVILTGSQMGVGAPRLTVKSMKGGGSMSTDDVQEVKHQIARLTQKSPHADAKPAFRGTGGPEDAYRDSNRYHGD